MTKLHISRGSKIGIHAQKPTPELFEHLERAVAQGAPLPVVKLTQEQTALRDVKERSPQTLTMARIVGPLDGLGGIDDISAADVPRWAEHIMTPIFDYYDRNPGLVDFVDIQEIVNEPDPPTERGWRNMGLVMKACVELGRRRLPALAWAIGSFNAGTPEWNEIVAFLDSGVLDGAHRAGDVINPGAALQRAIIEAGYVPYSTEFWKEFEDGHTYAIQTAFRWDTNERTVAFARVPDWHNVRIIRGPQG